MDAKKAIEYIPKSASFSLRAWKHWILGEPEIRKLSSLCDKKKISIDVGAHSGIYTYWMNKYSLFVHAFEPNPLLFNKLTQLVADRSIKVWPVALSDKSGDASLSVPVDPSTGRRIAGLGTIAHPKPSEASLHAYSVEMARLDDLGLNHVGFIKIDVEGAELAVLQGCAEVIARDRPNILVEAEDRHRTNAVGSVKDWLYSFKYRGFFFYKGDWVPIEEFHTETHQNIQTLGEERIRPHFYINNFAFFPEN